MTDILFSQIVLYLNRWQDTLLKSIDVIYLISFTSQLVKP